ncbi:MAG TPA: DNA recombination protein RmuC [Pseudobdellovibrionaceae bacterium]|nr:DNA recombination protein RmuC [Pseudobdellovibrionaceae bacterium]
MVFYFFVGISSLFLGFLLGFLYARKFSKNQNFELQQLQNDLQQRMQKDFENLAHRIFDEKGHRITDLQTQNLTMLLNPLKERLKDFEKKVEDTYSQERAERGVLKGELNRLFELNQHITQETKNLTQALKGENKTQGNWGELILENILERSGLREGHEYTLQGTSMALKNNEGGSLRPDVIINLPDNKHIIVDSKMSLNAFEAHASAETREEQARLAKMHVESIKRHVDGLSSKEYHASDKLISPDFVILFMPLEPAFALAFKEKPDLFQYAWEKNIAIVSPTTLLTTLRTVGAIWKQFRQEKNAMEIARRGGLLFEKFAGLLKDLQIVGEKIKSAQDAHTQVVKKLSEGRGNLIDQVEELKTLGAKTEKTLPELIL